MLDDDDGARVGVWVALGVVAMVLMGLVVGLGWRAVKPHGAPQAAAMAAPSGDAAAAGTATADADAVVDVPLSGEIIGKLYFAVGKADMPDDADATLMKAMDAVAAGGKKLMLSGFHDASGDPAFNAELAKNRAKAVREGLKGHGIAADRIVLRKPEQTTGDGPAEEARRVEIRLIDAP